MARRKVKLQYIINNTQRKTCLKKRREGLLKKIQELTILCDTSAFVVIYNPIEYELTMWPSLDKVRELWLRYQDLPEVEQHRRLFNQETYLREQIQRMEENILEIQRKNFQNEMNNLMNQIFIQGMPISSLKPTDMMKLLRFVDRRWQETRASVASLERLATGAPPPAGMDLDAMDEISAWLDVNNARMAFEKHLDEELELDLMEQTKQDDPASKSNIGSSIWPPADPFFGELSDIANVDKVMASEANFEGNDGRNVDMVIPEANFGGKSSENIGMEDLLGSSCGGNIGGGEKEMYFGNFVESIGLSNLTLPYGNFEGSSSKAVAEGSSSITYGGLNLPHGNFEGSSSRSTYGEGSSSKIYGALNLSSWNLGGTNIEADENNMGLLVNPRNFHHENGMGMAMELNQRCLGGPIIVDGNNGGLEHTIFHGNQNVDSFGVLNLGNFGGTNMELDLPRGNFGGGNLGAGEANDGDFSGGSGGIGGGMAQGLISNYYFDGGPIINNNIGGNLGIGQPIVHGGFASWSGGEGGGERVPGLFGRGSNGSDVASRNYDVTKAFLNPFFP